MSKKSQNNPFNELYGMVGNCDTFEEMVDRITILLEDECISKELNATLLAEALSMPLLAKQNLQLVDAVKDLQSKLESLMSDDEPTNIIEFPKNAIIN